MIFRFLGALFSLSLLCPLSAQTVPDLFIGRSAPGFTLKDLDGSPIQLDSLKGKIVVLDFWATWCSPCRTEMSMLEHISKKYRGKQVAVIGINSQEPAETVRPFAAHTKLTYPIVLTAGNPSVITDYRAWNLPTVVVVDKNGIVAAYRVGASPGSEDLLRDDLNRISSAKYVAPQPKFARLGQTVAVPASQSAPPNPLPAPAAADGPVAVDVKPRVISKIEPQYTDEARQAGVSTNILLAVRISATGLPENIRVARGAGFGLDEKAIESVSAWRFQPGERDGVPTAVESKIEVNFRLLRTRQEHQSARLNFTLPSGVTRPELGHGKVPNNPAGAGPAKLRVALSVGPDGKLSNHSILETTSPEWADKAMREIRDWRFYPAMLNGAPVEVQGVFELEVSSTGAAISQR